MKNILNVLLVNGYAEGNNCYYKIIGDTNIYFNADSDGEIVSVTYSQYPFNNQEILFEDYEDIRNLKAIEEAVCKSIK